MRLANLWYAEFSAERRRENEDAMRAVGCDEPAIEDFLSDYDRADDEARKAFLLEWLDCFMKVRSGTLEDSIH